MKIKIFLQYIVIIVIIIFCFSFKPNRARFLHPINKYYELMQFVL